MKLSVVQIGPRVSFHIDYNSIAETCRAFDNVMSALLDGQAIRLSWANIARMGSRGGKGGKRGS